MHIRFLFPYHARAGLSRPRIKAVNTISGSKRAYFPY